MTLDAVRAAAGVDRLGSRRVLVVEDDAWHHARMLAWLEREGVPGLGFVAVLSCDSEAIAGLDADGRESRIAHSEVGAAFLDYYFPGPFDGGMLARSLSNAGVRCFGMSSVAEKNRAMIARGATAAMLKRDLAALIG